MKTIESGFAIGLTGGIACGKSEVSRCLESEGVAILDTDHVAHEAMAPGEICYARVVEAFGSDMVDENGMINRGRLGKRVFDNAKERALLNRLVHPEVKRRWREWVRRGRDQDRIMAVLIPLLFEAGQDEGWDAIVCVSAQEEIVLQRLADRGLTPGDARKRLAAQWPLSKKEERSDFVIRNDGSLEELKKTTKQMLNNMLNKE